MSNFTKIIKKCESANGVGTKKIISAALAEADTVAQKLIYETLNSYRVFGIRKYDKPKRFNEHSSLHAFTNFFNLLDDLASRKLTGNAAREAVTSALSQFSEEDAKYISRVFDKDLKAGFSADTVNEVFAKNNITLQIPIFTVMLADKCNDEQEFENISFPAFADVKYDGTRTIAFHVNDSTFMPKGSSYRARSGKISNHLDGLFDEELSRIREYLGYDFVLDGETIASDFIETMNSKKEGHEGDIAKSNLKFRAFFIMPLVDWINQSTVLTMRENRILLEKILKDCNCKKIILTAGREVKDYHDMVIFCDEVTTPGYDNMPKGHEGLILKNYESTYLWDRSINWCKVKKFYDVDCRIVDFYLGRPKSRLANTLGGISVAGFLEDGTRIECNVGSGLTDELRHDIMNNKEKWLSRTVVIKYQEVSKTKNKAVASLRFPTYERWRDDKIVDI